jgi:hypothetical protein
VILYLLAFLLLLSSWAHALDIAVTREPVRTGTGTQDFEFTNFSADCTAVPCLAMFILTRATVDGVAAPHANIGVGFADGSQEVAVSVYAEDLANPTDTDRAARFGGEAFFLFSEAAVDGSADFSAWLTNGVQINVTDAFADQYLVTAVIFGGIVDSEMGKTQLGNVGAVADVTTVGFESDLVFFLWTRDAGSDDVANTTQFFGFGFAVNDGSDTQASIGCDASDGAAVSTPSVVTSSLYALRLPDVAGGVGPGVQVSDFDATGFSLTTRDKNTTTWARWVAVDLGTPNAAVVDFSAPTATGPQSVSVGFESQFGMILGTLARAYDTKETDSDADSCMIGVATADGAYVNQIVNDDGTSPTNTASGSNDSFAQVNPGDQSCVAGSCYVMTLSGFDASGWTLNYTSVFSDAVRPWVGLAIETEVAAPITTRRRRAPLAFR